MPVYPVRSMFPSVFLSWFLLALLALGASARAGDDSLDSYLSGATSADALFTPLKTEVIEKDGVHLRIPIPKGAEFRAFSPGEDRELTRLSFGSLPGNVTFVALLTSVGETDDPGAAIRGIAARYADADAIKEDATTSLAVWIGDRTKVSPSKDARVEASAKDRVLGLVGATVTVLSSKRRVVEMPGAVALGNRVVTLSMSIIGPDAKQDIGMATAWLDRFAEANRKPITPAEKASATVLEGSVVARKEQAAPDPAAFFVSPLIDPDMAFSEPMAIRFGKGSVLFPSPEEYAAEAENAAPFMAVATMGEPGGGFLMASVVSMRLMVEHGKAPVKIVGKEHLEILKKGYGAGNPGTEDVDSFVEDFRGEGFEVEVDFRHEVLQNTENTITAYNFVRITPPGGDETDALAFHVFSAGMVTGDDDMYRMLISILAPSEEEAKTLAMTWFNKFVELNR